LTLLLVAAPKAVPPVRTSRGQRPPRLPASSPPAPGVPWGLQAAPAPSPSLPAATAWTVSIGEAAAAVTGKVSAPAAPANKTVGGGDGRFPAARRTGFLNRYQARFPIVARIFDRRWRKFGFGERKQDPPQRNPTPLRVRGSRLTPSTSSKQTPRPGFTRRRCKHPGLVGDVPAHGRGLEPDDLQGPLQPKPFCDSMKSGVQAGDRHAPAQPLRLALGLRYAFTDFKTRRDTARTASPPSPRSEEVQ